MDRIQELLDKGIANLTSDELAEYRDLSAAEITARAAEPNDENLTIMRSLRDARVEAIELLTQIEADVATRAAEAAALVAEVTDPAEEVPAATDTTDADEDTDTDVTTVPPVVTPVPDPVTTTAEAPAPEAVAAAVAPKIDRSKAAAEARRGRVVPIRQADEMCVITAGGDIPGFASGQGISRDQVAEAFSERVRTLQSMGGTGKFPVARYAAQYPPERTLGRDPFENQRKIDAVTGPQAMVAAGGLCAPVAVSYDLAGVETNGRPLRDSLPRFNADRGGIRFIEPPLLTQLAGAVDIITEAEDVSGSTKPCLTVTCGDEVEVTVSAVTKCLQLGEFNFRFFREQFNRWSSLADAQHSREAEDELWNRMCTLATAVSGGTDTLGAVREFLPWLARAGSQMRSRHRMLADQTLRMAAPAWLLDLLVADLIRQQPGDGTLGVAKATVTGYIRALGIEPVWSLDGGGQSFGAQPAGAILGWPDTVEILLYPEGSFLFLDGGSLDIGIYRDNDLIVANNLRTFAETFENVAFVGVEALCAVLDICPSGLTSGQKDDYAPCSVGS